MGSYNKVCAISHAMIRPGDSVRLYFLVSDFFVAGSFKPEYDSLSKGFMCYPWNDFKVLGGLSIKAEYDGYGGFKFDQNHIATKYLHSLIVKGYCMNVSEKGKDYRRNNDYMDIPVNELTWDTILLMIKAGRLFMNGYGGNFPFVKMMAIHESVYQIMLEQEYSGYFDGGYNKRNFKKSLKIMLEKESNSDEISDEDFRILKVFTKKENKDEITKEDIEKYWPILAHHKDADNFDYEFSFGKKNALNGLKELKMSDSEFSSVDISEIVKMACEAIHVSKIMVDLNIMYKPSIIGNQETNLSSKIKFTKDISNALSTLDRHNDEYISGENQFKQWQEIKASNIARYFKKSKNAETLELFKAFLDGYKIGDKIEVKVDELATKPEYNFLLVNVFNKNLDLIIQYDKKVS